MKKFIQISGLLTLLVVLATTTTFAQSGYGTEVSIPFAFTIGDQSYDAGEYIVKIEKLATGAATLSITNTKTDEIQRVLMNVNGDAGTGEVKLVFDTVDGEKTLAKVRTPDRSYALIKSKSDKSSSKNRS